VVSHHDHKLLPVLIHHGVICVMRLCQTQFGVRP